MDRNLCFMHIITASAMVALRKESVDRNDIRYTTTTRPSMSLSARRAWIEIDIDGRLDADLVGRSPQGERG